MCNEIKCAVQENVQIGCTYLYLRKTYSVGCIYEILQEKMYSSNLLNHTVCQMSVRTKYKNIHNCQCVFEFNTFDQFNLISWELIMCI